MKQPVYKLIRMLLVAIPLLLAMAPAMAQTNTVYAGQSTELSVVPVPGDTYSWELYADVTGVNFATDPGNCDPTAVSFAGGISTGPQVNIQCAIPGTYFYKVTSQRAGCTMNLKVGKITVEQPPSSATLSLSETSVCYGQGSALVVNLTGNAPWSFTYRVTYPDGSAKDSTINNLATNSLTIPITPSNTGAYACQVISVTDALSTNLVPSNTVIFMVNAKPVSSRIYQYEPLNKKKK